MTSRSQRSHAADARRARRDRQLSADIASEHQPQLNQLRDEPVRSSHYDERHQQAEERDDRKD